MSKPRWLELFMQMTAEDEYPPYTLSTISREISSSGRAFYPRPHARTVIHRGVKLVPPAPAAPDAPPRLPVPVFVTTTDTRAKKAYELRTDPAAEATFWLPRAQAQFRLSGQAVVVRPPEDEDEDFVMDSPIDWEKERLRMFDERMSEHLRATFARPVAPGTQMASYDEAREWPVTVPSRAGAAEGGREQAAEAEAALAHFALVLLWANEVELLELEPVPNRRTRWVMKDNHEWVEQILVP